MLEKHLYTRTTINEWRYWENERHTGVVLVSRYDCLSSVIVSPYFLQTSSEYTPDLEHRAV